MQTGLAHEPTVVTVKLAHAIRPIHMQTPSPPEIAHATGLTEGDAFRAYLGLRHKQGRRWLWCCHHCLCCWSS